MIHTEEQRLRNALALYYCTDIHVTTMARIAAKVIDRLHLVDDAELLSWGLKKKHCAQLLHPNHDRIDQDICWACAPDHHIILMDHPHYPALLKEISDPPLLLFVSGNAACLMQNQFAIVGSRSSGVSACEIAAHFAEQLSAVSVITSGFASGIDASAHRGALRSGMTVAVMGTGLMSLYPRHHHPLAEQIMLNQGALVSEFPLYAPPRVHHFPKRNRIISGMSMGVLVVEAALKSGSLITARLAAEQGREVFAMPGAIHNFHARGCHHLIRQGAKLVEKVEDIIEELPLLAQSAAKVRSLSSPMLSAIDQQPVNADSLALLALFDSEAKSVDQLVQLSGWSAQQVSSILLLLEIEGYVLWSSGDYYLSNKACALPDKIAAYR